METDKLNNEELIQVTGGTIAKLDDLGPNGSKISAENIIATSSTKLIPVPAE